MALSRRSFIGSLFAVAASAAAGQGHEPSIQLTEQERLVISYFEAERGLKKFLLLSEKRGEIMMVDHGRIVARRSALSGQVSGDHAVVGSKVTPAGFFELTFSPDQDSPDAYMQFYRRADNSIDVIHPEIEVRGQKRAERLVSGKAEDKRISGGCVNVRRRDYAPLSAFAMAARQDFASVDGTRHLEGSFFIVLPENVSKTREILGIPAGYTPSP